VDSTAAEKLHTTMLRGLRASADLDVTLPLLKARRDAAIIQAVLDFNARKLDGPGAMLFVAKLAVMQDIEDDLKHIASQGQRAGKHLLDT
jgi:hypothetical protein